MNLAMIERIGAVVGGIIVAVVAFYGFWEDRKASGVENQVFKLMLILLGVGAVVALLAGLGILGSFGKAS
jgi:hypothetical protein